MAEFPAMPLWTDAYLADTGHLTTIEHGAYLLLLMAMWRAGGSLPNDDKRLARYARLTGGQWGRIKPALMPFFKVDGNTISQGRLTDELGFVRQRRAKQSDNAKSRWLKNNDSPDATALPNECQTDAPTPTPTSVSKDTQRAKRASPQSILEPVLGKDLASEVIAHRRRIRAPLGDRAAKKLADEFAKCANVAHAVDVMLASGWRGFEYDWYQNRLKSSPAPVQSAADRPAPEPVPERKPLTEEEREERRRIAAEAQAAIGYRVTTKRFPK